MANRLVVALSLLALAVSGAPLLIGDEVEPSENPRYPGSEPVTRPLAEPVAIRADQKVGSRTGGPVTIVYDDGIVSALPNLPGYTFGNQFNTASGSAITSFSLTRLSFGLVGGTGNVYVSIFGPVSGTSAPLIARISVPASSGGNTITIGPYAGVGSFQAGVLYTAGAAVGLGSGTVAGQGHHGMAINDVAGTDFRTLSGFNAMVRAGTAFIPVELIDFTVSDE